MNEYSYSICKHVYIHVCMYVYIPIYMCTYIDIDIDTYMYIHMYVCTYIHTSYICPSPKLPLPILRTALIKMYI